ncbi:hypothetical protein [Chryseobacterium indoltheticum]|uniref:HNH nuclease domain-containing protein n=1 Tax=Chryseobacterium indoltheticum TaxID=254 RepID=A0A3G6MY89_9FLAO|nr:hypothetical protein [Chryseobacterium indoltheticum]AZA60207.1 hypothetical protein EG340_03760 [Chryseobacterium indoltheticum]
MINLKHNSDAALRHFLSIENLLLNRIKNVLKNGIKKNDVKMTANAELKIYLKSLLTADNLKLLITAPPDSFPGIISSFRKFYSDFCNPATESSIILYNIFVSSCYDDTKRFSKYEFIANINIDTCPYCNRNYIYYISKEKEIKPQIDHFFPKTKYPFFAMSFYNLIPSCQTCNGFEAKGEKDPIRFGLKNPYLFDNDDIQFSYKPISCGILTSLLDKNSVKIEFKKEIPGNLKVFKLRELYDLHSDLVVELVIKSKVKYSETYRNYLKKYREKGLIFSENEIDRMILGNYGNIEEIHKRPFSKLYQDIGLELGLVKRSE